MKTTTQFDPRQEMRRPDFEIFHSQDTTLDTVEPHHHDFFEVYCFLQGQVEYRVEGVLYRPRPGDLLLIRPMQLHQVAVQSLTMPYERIVLWVGQGFFERLPGAGENLLGCFSSGGPVYLPYVPGRATMPSACYWNSFFRNNPSQEWGHPCSYRDVSFS